MRIREITVSYSRTFNLGDYNSARFECAITAELDDDDNDNEGEQEVLEDLRRIARESVQAQALPVLKRRNEEIDAIRAALPAEVRHAD